MDELAKKLREVYIEKLTKSYPLERVLVFFVYFLGRGFLNSKKTDGLVSFLFSFQLEGLKKLMTTATIGDVFVALVLSFLTVRFYFAIKKMFFYYLSSKQGFIERIKFWQEKTEKAVSKKAEYNKIIALQIREKIDSEKKNVARLHLLGEIFLSMSIVLFLSLFPFKLASNLINGEYVMSIDFVFFLVCLLLIVLIQRRSYLYYLKKLLPDLVSEAVFIQEDFNHAKAFVDEFSNDEMTA